MTNRTLRAALATFEVGSGLGGIWLVLASGLLQFRGGFALRIVWIALMVTYCAFLAASGFLLARRHPAGVRFSIYAQLLQVPEIITRPFTFVLYTPLSLTVTVSAKVDVSFVANLGANVQLLFGRTPEVALLGVNVLALAIVYLLRSRLGHDSGTADASSVAA